jgi:hypothetical protein
MEDFDISLSKLNGGKLGTIFKENGIYELKDQKVEVFRKIKIK